MSVIISLSDSNWAEFIGSQTSIVIFSKTDCIQCLEFVSKLEQSEITGRFSIGKLTLDEAGSAKLKISNPWVSTIDKLPFCSVFKGGKLVDSWAISNIDNFQNRIEKSISN